MFPELVVNDTNGCRMFSTANQQIAANARPGGVDVAPVAKGVTDGVAEPVIIEGVADGATIVEAAVANAATKPPASDSSGSEESLSGEGEPTPAAGAQNAASSRRTSTSSSSQPDEAKLSELVDAVLSTSCPTFETP